MRSTTSNKIMVLGTTGSGKSSLIYNLLHSNISKCIKNGIGESSHTTSIPCTFCCSEEIGTSEGSPNYNDIALRIDRKFLVYDPPTESTESIMQTILSVIQPILLGRFIYKDFNPEAAIDFLKDDDIIAMLEPENGEYNLSFLLHDRNFYEYYNADLNSDVDTNGILAFRKAFKSAFLPVLSYMEPKFKEKLSELSEKPKYQRSAITDMRELVFEILFEEYRRKGIKGSNSSQSDETFLSGYLTFKRFFTAIIKAIEKKLESILGTEYYNTLYASQTFRSENTPDFKVSLSLTNAEHCNILSELFKPDTPFSLIIDHIYISCQPSETLIKSYNRLWDSSELKKNLEQALNKVERYPLRFRITDTAFSTQPDTGYPTLRDNLESAFNQNPDCILFLLGIDTGKKAIKDCISSLTLIMNDLNSKNKSAVPLHILFTKSDRLAENILFKLDTSSYRLSKDSLSLENLDKISEIIDARISELAGSNTGTVCDKDQNIFIDWLSLRYFDEAEGKNNSKKKPAKKAENLTVESGFSHFSPDFLFDKISSILFKSTNNKIIKIIEKHFRLYHILRPIDPSGFPISVKLSKKALTEQMRKIQHYLSKEKDIVNGYTIAKNVPTFHASSVKTYFNRLRMGLGHSTKTATYGNFSINMKGLIKRALLKFLPDFDILKKNNAIEYHFNLSDEDIIKLAEFIKNDDSCNTETKASALTAISDAFSEAFGGADNPVYMYLINRVAYGLSYGNHHVCNRICQAYFEAPGYDSAMRNMQDAFTEFFSDPDPDKDSYPNILDDKEDKLHKNSFPSVFAEELEKAMTDMLNQKFIIC